MDQTTLAFNAVYLETARGYMGFVEEIPGVNAEGATLEDTRACLARLIAVAFDEERRAASELLGGRDVIRETFRVPLPGARA